MEYLKTKGAFELESGAQIEDITIAYTSLGQLNRHKSNVVWVFHALTGNCQPEEWWPGLVGEGKLIDPNDYYIICANILGSCYGSTNASSIDPATEEPYGKDFPLVTIRDMVKAHQILQEHLGIDEILLGIGGSMGGQQLLEWASITPSLFKNICVLASNARHSPWGVAFNETQRMAMEADPTFFDDVPNAGARGLAAARAVAMLSYRNYRTYQTTQSEASDERVDEFRASSYQQYQGEKLHKRFHPWAYWTLTKAMDSHHLGRGRGGEKAALQLIKANALIIGIESDVLFPVEEQAFIANHIPKAKLEIIDSTYGHDGFLIEFEIIARMVEPYLRNKVELNENSKYKLRQSSNSFGFLKREALPGTEYY